MDNNVFTSQTLWEGFDPGLEQLDTVIVKQIETNGIVSKDLYFTGRAVEHGQTRVFATVCHKGTSKDKPAVLVIGGFDKRIEEDVLLDLASRGFVAMSIDFAGRREVGLYTIYPDELEYCNLDAAKSMFEINQTARETKMYEYVLNCRRAITYLLQEEHVKSVSVLSSINGVFVGIMVLGVDDRVKNGALLFGNIFRNFPEPNSDEKRLKMDDDDFDKHLAYEMEKQMWTLGLAPQAYALQIKVPVYIVNSANSPYVDIAQTSKTFFRLNGESRLLILPTCMDCLPTRYTNDVVHWLKGYEAKPKSEISSFVDEKGDYCVRVKTTRPINKTSVWYCTSAEGMARYWTKATLTQSDNGYVAKLNLYEKQCTVASFALFDDDVSVSTPLLIESITANNPKKASNIIFTGTGKQNLITLAPGKAWWNQDVETKLAPGYLNLIGAKGTSLATFAINDKSIRIDPAFTLGFDVCSNVRQQIKLTAVCKFGHWIQRYSQTAEVFGTGKWERVTFDKCNFRRDTDGRQLTESEKVDLLTISADSEFIVNNIFLV